MYSERQKNLRHCKALRKDGLRCKGWARIGGDYCSLHDGFDAKAPRPKKGAERKAAQYKRAKKLAGKQRRAVCNCSAFPFPHRLSSGGCRYPEKPIYKSGDSEETERARERDDTRTERSEVTERDDREREEVDAVCNCSLLPRGHRLHPPNLTVESKRIEQRNDLDDLQNELEYQRQKLWQY